MHRLLLDAGKPQTAYSIGSEDGLKRNCMQPMDSIYQFSRLIGLTHPSNPARKYIKAS